MRAGRDEGSAALELVLIAPLLLVLLALVMASGRLVSAKTAVEAVAREAARAAAGAADTEAADSIARQRSREVASDFGLELSRLQVDTEVGSFTRRTPLTVSASYAVRLSDLPALGLIPGSLELSSRHVEYAERFKSR